MKTAQLYVLIAIILQSFTLSYAQTKPGQPGDKSITIPELVKILASSGVRTQRLFVLLDEKLTVSQQGLKGGPNEKVRPMIRHHIVAIDPESQMFRYDIIDYGISGRQPFVSSSFSDGVNRGRWDRGMGMEDVQLLLKGGDPGNKGGICYIGADACRSPDIILRILGITASGKPLPETINRMADTASIIEDTQNIARFTVKTKFNELSFDKQGVLRSYTTWSPNPAAPTELLADEKIVVQASDRLNGILIPVKVSRTILIENTIEESLFEVRIPQSRSLTKEQFSAYVNPILPPGVILTDNATHKSRTIEKPGAAFDVRIDSINSVEESRERLDQILEERSKILEKK